jgi:transposase
MEPSGGYERELLERLDQEGLAVAVVNARNIREFARASSRLAKTDVIDAAVLAHFAEEMRPKPRRLPDPQTRELRALIQPEGAVGANDDGRTESSVPCSEECERG